MDSLRIETFHKLTDVQKQFLKQKYPDKFDFYNKKIQNLYFNNNIIMKNEKNKIPLVLYKTGPQNLLSNNIKKLIEDNCKILKCTYVYFNDNECRDFIQYNFDNNVLKAYDSLIPTAFKADLFRYCILYKRGGIYGDLTQLNLRYININKHNVDMLIVKDRPVQEMLNVIQISFMATIPNNNFLKYLINQISDDILNKRKGNNPLDITGPRAFGRYFLKYFNINDIKSNLNTYTGLNQENYKINMPFKNIGDYISDINSGEVYVKNYLANHKKILYNLKNIHYDQLWHENNIFK